MADKVLMVGGGISGITAAVEAAEAGLEAVIVEKNAYLGGRVAQLHKYFPKLCPPLCGLEINFKRIKQNPKISFHTLAEVTGISGSEGNYDVKVNVNPRFVNEKCTGCGECVAACPGNALTISITGWTPPRRFISHTIWRFRCGMCSIKAPAAAVAAPASTPASTARSTWTCSRSRGSERQQRCIRDGLESVRCFQDRQPQLRHREERHHQRDDGAPFGSDRADPGQDPAAVRRQRGQEHRFRAVRRQP